MRRRLEQPLPHAVWPSGVCLAAFTPADATEVHALLTEAYAGGGGTVGEFAAWWDDLRGDSEFDPDLCFLARDGAGAIVGVAQCWTSGFVKDLAVRPVWRRRGVAAALLAHAFAVFRARDADAVELKVQADNRSAIRLYRRARMEVVETIAPAP
jgi:ribosomal protein S18 acetylase RimI-like enzyme